MMGNPIDVSFLNWGFFSTNNVLFTFFINADLLSALLKIGKFVYWLRWPRTNTMYVLIGIIHEL